MESQSHSFIAGLFVILLGLGGIAGALWLGGLRGLVRFAGGRFTRFTTAEGLSNDHVRAIHLSGHRRGTAPEQLMTQLRASFRIDFPETPLVSKTERMQRLYDQRGMKPR